MKKALSESDVARSPSGQYDTVSKRLIQQNPGETMHESSVIQHFTEKGIEQGIEQGERKGVLGSLLDILESRFQISEVRALKPTLEKIEEVQHLKEVLREAVRVSTLDEFKRILASNGN